ncbi:MAG: NUMOD3 domain-containing DNA-binding protein [Nitrosopumilus sp.]|nr:NUMOD3 domain-containing DNA-binding protein [Nitrosopumilus sp.]
MPSGVYKRSEETKKKMRERTNPMKGKHHSEETKKKIGLASKLKAKYFECSVDNCNKNHHARGLCRSHYDKKMNSTHEIKKRKRFR